MSWEDGGPHGPEAVAWPPNLSVPRHLYYAYLYIHIYMYIYKVYIYIFFLLAAEIKGYNENVNEKLYTRHGLTEGRLISHDALS